MKPVYRQKMERDFLNKFYPKRDLEKWYDTPDSKDESQFEEIRARKLFFSLKVGSAARKIVLKIREKWNVLFIVHVFQILRFGGAESINQITD